MATWSVETGSVIRTTLFFDLPSGAAWYGTEAGQIAAFSLLNLSSSSFGAGWLDAVAVLPSSDGLSLVIPVASGEIYTALRSGADRADANLVAAINAPLRAATRLIDGRVLVLDDQGRVHSVLPATGEAAILAEGPAEAQLLVADEATGQILLAWQGTSSMVARFGLADGTSIEPPETIPGAIRALSPSPNAPDIIVVDAAGVAFAYNSLGTLDDFAVSKPQLHTLCRWHSLIIAAAGSEVLLVEWGTDLDILPTTAALTPLVPGSWASVTADFGAAGFAVDDIAWRIEEGPLIATVSVARPVDDTGTSFELRVIAGPTASEFQLSGYVRSTGDVVARRRFRVLGHWPDRTLGPPMAITGVQRVYAKPGWGGGPTGPQNINLHPAFDKIRVAAAVFRTKGSSSAIDVQARIDQLEQDIIGPGQSSKTYYEEVSYWNTPASANPAHPKGTTLKLLGGKVFGPIDLDYSWADLFYTNDPDSEWSWWAPNGAAWDTLALAFSSHLLDLGLGDEVTQLADSFILMALPGTDDPFEVGGKRRPAQWTWAFAGDAKVYWKGPYSTTITHRAAIVMPAAFPLNHPLPWSARDWVATICHELGHNLGCPDLYNYGAYPPEMAAREVDSWDLMNADGPLPHFSLPHRMRLGWISPDWIESCDFGQNPASRTVTLQAIETLGRSGPPPGRKAGVEIRIRDGWNYYFEYRCKQPGQIGDQRLPAASAIFGSDVSQAAAEEIARALILKLPSDLDGDGPVLRLVNQDYEESDVTNPDRMNDFRFTRRRRVRGDPNAVMVDIEYVGAHRAELQITPAPGRGDFKSPDIDLDGPAGPNVVVTGKINSIKVRVRNRGTKAADKVQIRVAWLAFTSSPGNWNPLPNPPTKHIPAHATREFVISWAVPASVEVDGKQAQHFCIKVDVDRYVDPADPSGDEIVVHNNYAQSNFSTSAVGHGSPSERRTTVVSATNVLPMRAMHRTLVEQSDPNFRTFVDHGWRLLDPGETDATVLSYESLAGDPLHDRDFQIAFREAADLGLVNQISARTFFMPSRESDGPIERWGVRLDVRAGIRTVIDRIAARGEVVRGKVWAEAEGRLFSASGGAVRLVAWPQARPEEQRVSEAQVTGDGKFSLAVPAELVPLANQEPIIVQVFYHGTAHFAPSRSQEHRLGTG